MKYHEVCVVCEACFRNIKINFNSIQYIYYI